MQVLSERAIVDEREEVEDGEHAGRTCFHTDREQATERDLHTIREEHV
jgi:hypothetical protein